jgi:8-oxo-dGTP pyrophosphatase MutT (NUDIX family)
MRTMKGGISIFVDERVIRFRTVEKVEEDQEVRHREWERAVESFLEDPSVPELVFYCSDWKNDFSAFFLPMFRLISAAGGVVRSEKGEILFIRRFGKWDLPKGKVSRKDKKSSGRRKAGDYIPGLLGRAAIREVCEETGLKMVRIVKRLSPTYHVYSEKGRWILKKTSWFMMVTSGNKKLEPQEEEGISDVRWLRPEEAEKVLPETYRSLVQLIRSVL